MICTDLLHGCSFPEGPKRPLVLALGNFDGVHIAHKQLIRLAVQLRNDRFPNADVGAWYFSELPERYLPGNPVPALTSPEQKRELLAEAGAELACAFSFPELRQASPDDFIRQVLKDRCHAVGVVCGYNFRFGRNAEGTTDILTAAFPEAVRILPEVRLNGETVSSSRIRALLEHGKPEQANAMLGYTFEIRYPVVHGKHLGTTIGIPTINQVFPSDSSMVIPCFGVYATETVIDGISYYGISNVGVRPTVENTNTVNCETHLFDYRGDLYGKTVRVRFHRFLRKEKCFASVDQLRLTIEQDIRTVKAFFAGFHTP